MTSSPALAAQRPGRGGLLAWLALVAFGLIPLLVIASKGGGGSLTGATGIFPADQLQYFAWIRDLSEHVLARNSFDLAPSSRVFIDPIFALSGLLVRLGLSPGWAYGLWLPAAAAALLAAFASYARRLIPERRARIAAVVLALFAASPLAPLVDNVGGLDTERHNQLAKAVADVTPGLQLWGYFPIAIALALMCVALLALERAIDPARRATGRAAPAEIAIAALAAAIAGWLHPWQGATLLIVFAALAALERTRAALVACAAAAAGALLPLVYYYVLPHIDDAWAAARASNSAAGFGWWVAPATLGPLSVAALLGVRPPPARDVQERLLILWPLAAALLYLLDPPYSVHALESASLPLAILAVRGAVRLKVALPIAILLIVLATEPGLMFAGSLLDKATDQHSSAYALPHDDVRALNVVERSPLRGGVVAPASLSPAVPAYTGRPTWFGHPSWTPRLSVRAAEAGRFFSGHMRPAAAQRFATQTGARFFVAPCGSNPALPRVVGPLLRASATTVGCATVLTVRP